MTICALRGFATVVLCTTAAIPANARTGWDQMAPHWLDQTIFQPSCSSSVCACDCSLGRICPPDCVW